MKRELPRVMSQWLQCLAVLSFCMQWFRGYLVVSGQFGALDENTCVCDITSISPVEYMASPSDLTLFLPFSVLVYRLLSS